MKQASVLTTHLCPTTPFWRSLQPSTQKWSWYDVKRPPPAQIPMASVVRVWFQRPQLPADAGPCRVLALRLPLTFFVRALGYADA